MEMPVKFKKPTNETEAETDARLRKAGRLLHEALKPRGPVVRRELQEKSK